jgi:hypothetical protein
MTAKKKTGMPNNRNQKASRVENKELPITQRKTHDWFNNPRNLIDESDSSTDMVKDWNLSYLLPRHRDVFKKFHHGMRNVFKSSEMDTFVGSELSRTKGGKKGLGVSVGGKFQELRFRTKKKTKIPNSPSSNSYLHDL